MTKGEKNKRLLIDYLSDPENKFLSRAALAVTVLGYSHAQSLYDTLTPSELDELEIEAFEIRKKRCARQRSEVYFSLHREAKKGNVAAAKEWLDRVEGKVKEKIQLDGKVEHTCIKMVGVAPDPGKIKPDK